ncbi:hypothetical protein TNCT_718521 [Trichonephila clavata]|uniref:Uncharacterized protein n=1 Tax=Trichonephila clavata TaxID=2740835 RepID=A0A8X6IHE7_TRICU|nr:hypothetical protein TNCT_718521 [Trichonephila clavata]
MATGTCNLNKLVEIATDLPTGNKSYFSMSPALTWSTVMAKLKLKICPLAGIMISLVISSPVRSSWTGFWQQESMGDVETR